MEQQFFENEFEQFLKENADQHRMYPSDGVWTNIYRRMHPGRRRVALGALLLLVLSGIVWLSTTDAVDRSRRPAKNISSTSVSEHSLYGESSGVTVHDIIAKLRAKSLIPPMAIEAPIRLTPLKIQANTEGSTLIAFDPSGIRVGPLALAPTLAAANLLLQEINSTQYSQLIVHNGTLPATGILPGSNTTLYAQQPASIANAGSRNGVSGLVSANEIIKPEAETESEVTLVPNVNARLGKDEGNPPTTTFIPLPVTPSTSLQASSTSIPVVDNRLIKFRMPARRNFSFLMHFAPTIGYRNLFEGKSRPTYGNSPLMVRHLNVNQFVNHQPAIGFELGGAFRYQASKAFSIRSGLQLNLTRYKIEAFSHLLEKTTVALQSEYGYRRDTLVATSNVRNLAGDNPRSMQNQYLQLTIPIAAELKLMGDQKLQVNIAAGLQPSYLLNTNQYLLSSNLSNYVREPSLVRRWNMASSLEAFVSYQSGDIRWQVGPQFRYNLFSTYKKEYPIRENLMEYGMKIGVSKTLR